MCLLIKSLSVLWKRICNVCTKIGYVGVVKNFDKGKLALPEIGRVAICPFFRSVKSITIASKKVVRVFYGLYSAYVKTHKAFCSLLMLELTDRGNGHITTRQIFYNANFPFLEFFWPSCIEHIPIV